MGHTRFYFQSLSPNGAPDEKYIELDGMISGSRINVHIPSCTSELRTYRRILNGKTQGPVELLIKKCDTEQTMLLDPEFYSPLLEQLRTSKDFVVYNQEKSPENGTLHILPIQAIPKPENGKPPKTEPVLIKQVLIETTYKSEIGMDIGVGGESIHLEPIFVVSEGGEKIRLPTKIKIERFFYDSDVSHDEGKNHFFVYISNGEKRLLKLHNDYYTTLLREIFVNKKDFFTHNETSSSDRRRKKIEEPI